MEIGVIGIGNIGGTLSRKLSAAGHRVRVSNSRGPESVQSFATEIGAVAVDTRGAIAGADLIIVSIPFPAIATLPQGLFDNVPQNVPIIDTSNYYPGLRDPHIPELDAGEVESLWVSKHLGRPVIKAFNNILAHSLGELGRPEGSAGRLAVAVAGDALASKKVVMDLVNVIGFDPVDSGTLTDSWRQQPSTPGYCCDYDAETMRRALAAAVEGEAPKKRDQLPGLWATSLGANPSHADIVALNRSLNPLD
ncbi:NAD(P)-binding domain-containing protein [Paraburkholderia sp. CNPSo 3076]|uniref:NADPH-dependent F420 reductase n=1 Tax=Paraburkholderia sp. CNPSo 3076 TaxID=2940936 RepID=UPI0022588AA0|nr:NAD(P)-binding domain-containing protein [Paraburkholderia sp. CNPSo 3076]MCX5541125.1 NAD(P)-binding domain-containing protein [Paraburkholderia sp. CNPSo 3076]